MDKKLVVPGDFIGIEEEYLPGAGTFADNEKVYAALTGEISDKDRTLAVQQKRPWKALAPGMVILGRVENISEPIALVSVMVGGAEIRFSETNDYAVLHASMIKRGYVKNVRDEYKVGDIIRAKIVDMRNGELRLATDSDELGAIKAFCPKCRHGMKVESGILKCEDCEWKDNRKIAKDYRKANIDGKGW
ncbi:MAG: exosome complex RNA-binding protein Csl4 [Candidatus Micrarchaeia archaeon]